MNISHCLTVRLRLATNFRSDEYIFSLYTAGFDSFADTFGVPVVFAKKSKSDNIEGGLYTCDIFSYTYKKKVTLLVAKDWIRSGDKVLVVDDFLANGEALRGLCQIVHDAGAELLGIGVAIEKGFQHGGDRIREAGLNLQSLVIIDKADEDGFVFRESWKLFQNL